MIFFISTIIATFTTFPGATSQKQSRYRQSLIQVCIIGCIWCFTSYTIPLYFILFGYSYYLINVCFESVVTSLQAIISFKISKFLITTVTKNDIEVKLVEKPLNTILNEVHCDDFIKSDSGKPLILVHHPIEFFWGIVGGDLGVGESYMNGDWSEVKNINNNEERSEELFKILRTFAKYNNSVYLTYINHLRVLLPQYWIRKFNFTKKFGSLDIESSAESIASHYDDGNDLFKSFLDDNMVYTSAIFDDSKSYDDPSNSLCVSQLRKIERILELCNLPEGGKVLDIGSGCPPSAATHRR